MTRSMSTNDMKHAGTYGNSGDDSNDDIKGNVLFKSINGSNHHHHRSINHIYYHE